MKKTAWKIILFSFLVTCYLLLATKANAQIFTLSPSSTTKPAGEEFAVNLNIDTQNQAAASADVKLTFNSSILEVVKVDNGDFFEDTANYIGTGTLYTGGFFKEQFKTKTGQGILAVITLKGKTAGNSALTFVCSSEKNDSNILDAAAADIINCTGISDGSYTINGTGAPEPTSTPVSATPAGPTPTMAVPVSGNFLPTAIFGISGALLTILGIAIIL